MAGNNKREEVKKEAYMYMWKYYDFTGKSVKQMVNEHRYSLDPYKSLSRLYPLLLKTLLTRPWIFNVSFGKFILIPKRAPRCRAYFSWGIWSLHWYFKRINHFVIIIYLSLENETKKQTLWTHCCSLCFPSLLHLLLRSPRLCLEINWLQLTICLVACFLRYRHLLTLLHPWQILP